MKVIVDREACTGHGRCVAVAPDVFELDDLGYNAIDERDVPEELEAQARSAAATCPERCIRIEEA